MSRLLLLALLLVACDASDRSISADAGGQGAAPEGQGSTARGALVINEVAPKPATGSDWIEIYNRSDAAIDLCEFFVTDSLDRLDHYHHLGAAPPPARCEPVFLAAGDYLVIYTDDDTALGPEHAPFKLGLADEAHIVSVAGEAIDSLVFLMAGADEGLSLARSPNGEGLFWVGTPSLGEENL